MTLRSCRVACRCDSHRRAKPWNCWTAGPSLWQPTSWSSPTTAGPSHWLASWAGGALAWSRQPRQCCSSQPASRLRPSLVGPGVTACRPMPANALSAASIPRVNKPPSIARHSCCCRSAVARQAPWSVLQAKISMRRGQPWCCGASNWRAWLALRCLMKPCAQRCYRCRCR